MTLQLDLEIDQRYTFEAADKVWDWLMQTKRTVKLVPAHVMVDGSVYHPDLVPADKEALEHFLKLSFMNCKGAIKTAEPGGEIPLQVEDGVQR